MILDGVLAAAGDEDDVVDARRHRFLDAVLNDRLVDERQHFLRLRLRRRKESSAEAGRRKHRFSYSSHGKIVTYNGDSICSTPPLFAIIPRPCAQACAIGASMATRRSRTSRRSRTRAGGSF